MIKPFQAEDSVRVAEIWLRANLQAHDFIEPQYWLDNLPFVQAQLAQAEVYVYIEEKSGLIQGFVGLQDDYIAGIFVWPAVQSSGIGKKLLDFVKTRYAKLTLSVYQKNKRAVKFYCRENFVLQSIATSQATGEEEYTLVWQRQ